MYCFKKKENILYLKRELIRILSPYTEANTKVSEILFDWKELMNLCQSDILSVIYS